ncbi:MAG: extracellular solute-binding protein, partial [Pseudomonadota bacterium]
PYLASLAWQGYLLPLDELLPGELGDDLLPSILAQGTWQGRLYSVASFDSGLGIYAARDKLVEVSARIPKGPSDAWTAAEFEQILQALAARDADGAVLDLKLNYPDEWLTYGFSPVLQSAGADLVDRSTYRSASGVLNGAKARAAMEQVQGWFAHGFVDPNVDDAAFASGRVALSWVGHWMYGPYREALGENLVVVPLPDFGIGMRTGQGSWSWGVTRACRDPEAASQFLAFLLQRDEVLAMADANGAVPATRSAIAHSTLYGPNGPLHLFARQLLEGYAVPRPRTPAYPVVSAAFAQAFRDIRHGEGVQRALDRATMLIDRDIADNHGYALPETSSLHVP